MNKHKSKRRAGTNRTADWDYSLVHYRGVIDKADSADYSSSVRNGPGSYGKVSSRCSNIISGFIL